MPIFLLAASHLLFKVVTYYLMVLIYYKISDGLCILSGQKQALIMLRALVRFQSEPQEVCNNGKE